MARSGSRIGGNANGWPLRGLGGWHSTRAEGSCPRIFSRLSSLFRAGVLRSCPGEHCFATSQLAAVGGKKHEQKKLF